MHDDLTDADMLVMAVVFDVYVDTKSKKTIRVEARYPSDGGKVWAVVNEAKFVLNKSGDWEYESPLISARDDEFIYRTRWDDPRQAIRAALAARAAQASVDVEHAAMAAEHSNHEHSNQDHVE
jgi:hypothetical protein